MRKLFLFLMAFGLSLTSMYAQSKVSGKVTDSDGVALEGVAVIVYGTTIGDFTDAEGMYTLEVPEGSDKLVFRYVGKKTIELPIEGPTVNASMQEDNVMLDEVVVTALGIKREEKSLGYSVQEVSSDEINRAAEANLATGLSGKVAGIQVISASGASLGGSARVRLRGANTLNGGGAPLWVVDGTPMTNANFSGSYRGSDFGNLAQDINPDDIESVTVLKGPAAAALYGNRGAFGVIMVTTKSGKNRGGVGVDINSSVTMDNVYIMPEYQNEYAGGYTQNFIPFEYNPAVHPESYAAFDGHNMLNYAADESWGPKMDGSMYRPWYSWFPTDSRFGQQAALTPNEDNVKNFFDTGLTFKNNIALSGGDEKTNARLSYTNFHQTGVIPNSQLDRNTINLKATTALGERITLNASANYVGLEGQARPEFGYVGNNATLSFNQWFQRQLDIEDLRDYVAEDGTFKSWNIRSATDLRPLYWDSPFVSTNENFSTDSRERLYGNVGLNFDLTDHLKLTTAARMDQYVQRIESRTASGTLDQDFYSESVRNAKETNYELNLIYENTFGDVSLFATAGGNIRQNEYRSNYMGTVGGLTVPNLFGIESSTDRPSVSDFRSLKEVRSAYMSASVGYKDFVFVEGNVRNDINSDLPDDKSHLYGSISGSFVFSELIPQNPVFTYGKFRVGVAQVGQDWTDYSSRYDAWWYSPGYSNAGIYGSSAAFTVPNTITGNVTPAIKQTAEIGVDLAFFDNRLSGEFTLYKNTNIDEIISVPVAATSGFSTAVINAGKLTSQGFEMALRGSVVKTQDMEWNLGFNLARNTSSVVELTDEIDTYRLDGWGWGGFSVFATAGEEFGVMQGTAFARDEAGNKLVDENGYYITERDQNLGTFLPDFTGGVSSDFSWKGFTVGAFLDFQVGGQVHSVTRMFNAYSGLNMETVGMNDLGNPVRDAVANGGGVLADGVYEDGTPNATHVEAQDYFKSLFALHEAWIYDASYLKLRQVSIGYALPKSLLAKTPIQRASLSLIGRNVWLIKTNIDGIDPSEIPPGSNSYVFQENGILPSTRSFGVNLKLSF
ncbi:SusC/RagA family TonB-linked outer membrane protein [Pontibacter sp. G13]|uniref:SusC/RagA family TonB-linked outer membrane protein n=1 Tax=Pontibacter sp. G13 TaxID=3074898 RepID=UPI00288952C7|nr:SusC/RagA family TonB-linked outer membrane protein [Pontibacter sp. G13]WNJ18122.1 SusC/RagA family TonB-linked outer membrane protein [Pontibacter sp. G13]